MNSKEIRILTLLVIDTSFFLLEVIVGYAVHSLALVADSFHMLNDVFSLLVALWAVKVAKSRGPDSKYTYGWQRAEILGALINAVFLLALCLTIFLEAIQRFFEPQVITNPVMILVVGCAGLVSNIVGLLLFHEHGHGHDHNYSHGHGHGDDDEEDEIPSDRFDSERLAALIPQNAVQDINETTSLLQIREATLARERAEVQGNRRRSNSQLSETHFNHFHSKPKDKSRGSRGSLNMKGVFLHVMGDALGNIGVIATALFIWKTDYSWKYYMDPVISLVITVIIFSSALPLCKLSSSILLQGVPQNVNADEVKFDVASLPGVVDIHDLHIWILKEDLFIATMHVSVSLDEEEFMELAQKIRACLHGHGIHSTTIQPEFNTHSQTHNHSGTYGSTTSPSYKASTSANSESSDEECMPACAIRGNTITGGLYSPGSQTNLNNNN
jgi:solute carrier family 30 (zinc transporter), member 1